MQKYYPYLFNATALVEAAASFGASYAILVVNQMLGFALWDTKANNFSTSPIPGPYRGGKYDIVKEYVAACAHFGLKPGLFYSANRNDYNGIGNHGLLGPRNLNATEQDAFNVLQLSELMFNYGDIFELWLDGGVGREYVQTAAFLLEHGHKWTTHGFPAVNGVRWVGTR
jgi:alpha-L-fucosidase